MSTSTMQKLIATRTNCIDTLQYHFAIITAYNDQTNPTLITCRKEALMTAYTKFITNWDTIIISPDPKNELTNATQHLQVNHELEDKYIAARATLEELVPTPANPSLSSTILNGDIPIPTNSQFKLPSITIKPFNGEFDEWEEFRDTFKACVADSRNSDCQKFLYLRGVLGEQPAALIKNLRATNENYAAAWKILEERYTNNRRIVYTHFRNLMDITAIHTENPSEIRRMLDTANASITALKLHNNDLGQ